MSVELTEFRAGANSGPPPTNFGQGVACRDVELQGAETSLPVPQDVERDTQGFLAGEDIRRRRRRRFVVLLSAAAILLLAGIGLHGRSDDGRTEQPSSHPGTPGSPPTTPGLSERRLQRILFGSCSDQERSQAFWDTALGRRADLIVLLGDNVYGDCQEAHCNRLTDAYANLSASPAFRRARATVELAVTWDDHDYGQSDGGSSFAWKERAKQIFLDFWAADAEDLRRKGGRGVHSSLLWGPAGQRVQLILLDTRWYRSPLQRVAQPSPGRERYTPANGTMLGEEQWRWLELELARPAELRLLATSVQLLSLAHGYEKWGNFPTERTRLLRLLRAARPVPLVLSGDRHVGGLYVERDGEGAEVWELTASSFTHTSSRPPSELERQDPRRAGALIHENHWGQIFVDWGRRRVSADFLGAETGLAGQADPSNASLPQQPLHPYLFKKVRACRSFRSVSNPYECSLPGGFRVLGHSGQPVTDLLRCVTKSTSPLKALQTSLEALHLAPTAPDSLAVQPCSQGDPFVIGEVPHVLFSGGHDTGAHRWFAPTQPGVGTMLVCVPAFHKSPVVTLVNLRAPSDVQVVRCDHDEPRT